MTLAQVSPNCRVGPKRVGFVDGDGVSRPGNLVLERVYRCLVRGQAASPLEFHDKITKHGTGVSIMEVEDLYVFYKRQGRQCVPSSWHAARYSKVDVMKCHLLDYMFSFDYSESRAEERGEW